MKWHGRRQSSNVSVITPPPKEIYDTLYEYFYEPEWGSDIVPHDPRTVKADMTAPTGNSEFARQAQHEAAGMDALLQAFKDRALQRMMEGRGSDRSVDNWRM